MTGSRIRISPRSEWKAESNRLILGAVELYSFSEALMDYAPSKDRKGSDLHPGDRVRIKLYPRGIAEGIVAVSKRAVEVLPDGSTLPALVIDADGRTYSMPSSKGVLKLG